MSAPQTGRTPRKLSARRLAWRLVAVLRDPQICPSYPCYSLAGGQVEADSPENRQSDQSGGLHCIRHHKRNPATGRRRPNKASKRMLQPAPERSAANRLRWQGQSSRERHGAGADPTYHRDRQRILQPLIHHLLPFFFGPACPLSRVFRNHSGGQARPRLSVTLQRGGEFFYLVAALLFPSTPRSRSKSCSTIHCETGYHCGVRPTLRAQNSPSSRP